MSKEAMKLALEALEFIPESGSMLGTQAETKRLQAITVLREALAEQPAQQEPGRNHWEDGDVFERIAAIKEQPAQQEPVAWGVDWGKAGDIPCVSIIKRMPGGGIEVVAVEYAPYEYNPPAQRTWVGLTEDEVTLCHSLAVLSKKHDGTDPSFTTLLHQQIEAKLKEKNT